MKFFIVALFIQLSLFAYAQHHKSADLLTDIIILTHKGEYQQAMQLLENEIELTSNYSPGMLQNYINIFLSCYNDPKLNLAEPKRMVVQANTFLRKYKMHLSNKLKRELLYYNHLILTKYYFHAEKSDSTEIFRKLLYEDIDYAKENKSMSIYNFIKEDKNGIYIEAWEYLIEHNTKKGIWFKFSFFVKNKITKINEHYVFARRNHSHFNQLVIMKVVDENSSPDALYINFDEYEISSMATLSEITEMFFKFYEGHKNK
jgi:hypothetical protein